MEQASIAADAASPVDRQLRLWRDHRRPVAPDARMRALTEQRLGPLLGDLEALMLELRHGVDRDVASGRLPMPRRRHPFPKGFCREITDAVFARLGQRIAAPDTPVTHALAAFVRAGGTLSPVWGALRGSYFQNAMQVGALYVDAANDTVTVTKPKVEILPLESSGLEAITDVGHFARIAELYWGGTIWANTLFPRLAPVLPIIHIGPDGRPALHPDGIGVFAENLAGGCRSALAFLEQQRDSGRTPPAEVAALFVPWKDRGPWFAEFHPTPDWNRLRACFALAEQPQGPYRSVQGFLEMVEAVKRTGPA
ncbi:hypothetical protein [Azospirillum isscasi]|uniref:Uncharacterized protein n=1 Tax=Azospirillum isscasi TaxID=3053926 RepID=A0ABU0WQS6_9PROT|nr:hypothetical protein [Azospirillum isscasi]MDQ2106596.1 hypothetical protein [Azospirillum isscasi]